MTVYIFKVLNPDGTDFKMTPTSKFMKIRVEAETQEAATSEAEVIMVNYLGNNGYTLEFLGTEETFAE